MPRDKVLTREELYDLVWSRPMTAIAAEFGMSSVAFAKYCAKLDVPRPGRGHWAQIEAGYKAPRERLPKARLNTPLTVTIERRARPPERHRAKASDVDAISISIPDRINRLHPVVKELEERLGKSIHHQGLLTVRGQWHPVLKVNEESKRRALRLLHVLFIELERRDHEVTLTPGGSDDSRTRWCSLLVKAGGGSVRLSLQERLKQVPAQKKEWHFFERKIDLAASGELHLAIEIGWEAGVVQTKWRDRDDKKLEACLGQIVWTVGEAARSWPAHQARVEEEQRRAEADRRRAEELQRDRERKAAEEKERQRQEARRAAREKALADDLVSAATSWRLADTLRGFLAALDDRIPVERRTDEVTAWFTWAWNHAEAIDPLRAPEKVPRPLEPSG